MTKGLLLDRDGVINLDTGYVHTPEATQFVPGIFEFCKEAAARAYTICVVTNQAGIGHGYYTEAQFLEYTRWFEAQFSSRGLVLARTYYSPFHPEATVPAYRKDSELRKPRPGMLLQAMEDFALIPEHCMMIGDRLSDMEAAFHARVPTRLLHIAGKTHATPQPEEGEDSAPMDTGHATAVIRTIPEAEHWLR